MANAYIWVISLPFLKTADIFFHFWPFAWLVMVRWKIDTRSWVINFNFTSNSFILKNSKKPRKNRHLYFIWQFDTCSF